MEHVEIEHVFYPCRKMKRRVIITCLATPPPPPSRPSAPLLPELTAFDCNFKDRCGVCTLKGQHTACCWEECVHPGLAEQESWTE